MELDSADNNILKIKLNDEEKYQRLHLEKFGKEGYLIQGKFYEDSISAQVRLVPTKENRLLNRGFNWIQEAPFNR